MMCGWLRDDIISISLLIWMRSCSSFILSFRIDLIATWRERVFQDDYHWKCPWKHNLLLRIHNRKVASYECMLKEWWYPNLNWANWSPFLSQKHDHNHRLQTAKFCTLAEEPQFTKCACKHHPWRMIFSTVIWSWFSTEEPMCLHWQLKQWLVSTQSDLLTKETFL